MIIMKDFKSIKNNIFDNIPGGFLIFKADENKTILYANKKVIELFECDSFEDFLSFTDSSFLSMINRDEKKIVETGISYRLASGYDDFNYINFHIRTKLNILKLVEMHGKLSSNGDEKLYYVFMTENYMKNQLYEIDEITGLPGKRKFLDYSYNFLSKVYKCDSHLNYLYVYFNLVHFKSFNIRYGIDAGNNFLKGVTDLLMDVFKNDIISRIGDDHFVILTDDKNYVERIEKVKQVLINKYIDESMYLRVGIYQIEKEDLCYLDKALDYAKIASAKIENDDTQFYRLYDDQLKKEAELNAYITSNLTRALEEKYIQIYYQPVVRTINSNLCGAEALTRWVDPKYGMISPSVFIPLLEECKQIHRLDKFVFEEICKNLRMRLDREENVIPISFNLSRLDFILCDIYLFIDETCEKYKIPHHLINIEITESIVMSDANKMKKEMKRFHDAGFAIWMDDFGSGYSSLDVLKEFTFDELKLDMKFLSPFTEKAKKIIASVVKMAKEIGVQTLAEGVENEEQFEFLKFIGCEKTQGFLFSKPLPYDEMINKIYGKDIQMETTIYRRYYDAMTKIDFMSDAPLAIIEDTSIDFKLLYVNKTTFHNLSSLNVTDIPSLYELLNSNQYVVAKKLRDFIKKPINTNNTEYFYCSMHGQYLKMDVKLISTNGLCHMFMFKIHNITHDEDSGYVSLFDKSIRETYMMYESFDLLNPQDNSFSSLRPYLNVDVSSEFNVSDLRNSTIYFINTYIYKYDRERYKKFIDLTTIENRISYSSKGYVYDYFRSLGKNKEFGWKQFSLIPITIDDKRMYILTVSECKWSDEVLKESYDSFKRHEEENKSIEEGKQHDEFLSKTILNTLFDNSLLKIFTKDKNGRFKEISSSFLDSFGLKLNDVINKTSDELEWFLDKRDIISEDKAVLKDGKTIINAIARCNIKGSQHIIQYSKIPIYINGQISGLIGYFEDIEKDDNNTKRDYLTPLLSPIGIIDDYLRYIEEYKNHNKRFAMHIMQVESLLEIKRVYSEDTYIKALNAVADLLIKEVGSTSSIARIEENCFVILQRFNEIEEIDELEENIKNKIKNIQNIGNDRVTLYTSFITCLDERCEFSPDVLYKNLLKNS